VSRDYLAIAAQYQADILNGTIPASAQVQRACARNRRDLDRQDTPGFPFHFDPELAVRICRFAELLPYVTGRGFAEVVARDEHDLPIWRTLVLQPWQCWVFTTLYGWANAKGLRRFRIALILVPRKNAKSTMGAVLALYGLTEEHEPGALCVSAATTREQAKAVADIAWEMAKRSPQFREYYGVRLGSETSRSLTVPATASKFLPLSADANSLDGLNISLAIVDELHAHKTPAVWNVIDTATGARLQPLIIGISTAGVEIGGICHQKLGYLEKVLDGVAIDEAFFGTVYGIDPGDDIRQPAVQQKANPSYGVSVQADDLVRKIAEAQHSPAALNNILTKHFNVWIRTESSWMTATLWQTCAVEGVTIEALKGFPCWIGVDLAEVRDIAALVAVFQIAADAYAIVGRFYLPKATIDRSPIAQMSGWVHEGHIIETDGDQADFARIQADLVRWCDLLLQVREIDFDRALAAQMQQELKRVLEPRMGRDAVDRFVVTVPQTVETMDPAMKLTERLVLAKKLQHDGNPAMAWMITNVVIERSYKDEIYPRKAGGKDSANKIDGPVAMWTALSRAMAAPVRQPEYQILVLGGRKG
jgi:phage terminase large subunit-like protein